MAYDAARAVTVLFGGSQGIISNDETWEWNGTAWVQQVVGGPSAREGHAMACDAARAVTVLFGGVADNAGINGETWEWNGAAWTQRLVSGPSARHSPAMSYDAARGLTVLFGGWTVSASDGENGETWELGMPCEAPSITSQPVAQTVCPGGSASFAVIAADEEQMSYQWREDSVNLTDEPNRISGANTATLVIVNATAADEGSYDCIVSNACAGVTSDAAILTICPADFDCDGAVNSQDFFDFLGAFFASAAAADFTHDGAVNSQDFFDFLTAFFAGCP
jgi:hypothetical protein